MSDNQPARKRHRKKKSLHRRIKAKIERYVGQDVLYIFLAVLLALVAGYFALKYIARMGAE